VKDLTMRMPEGADYMEFVAPLADYHTGFLPPAPITQALLSLAPDYNPSSESGFSELTAGGGSAAWSVLVLAERRLVHIQATAIARRWTASTQEAPPFELESWSWPIEAISCIRVVGIDEPPGNEGLTTWDARYVVEVGGLEIQLPRGARNENAGRRETLEQFVHRLIGEVS
jgi:hypothetical protein